MIETVKDVDRLVELWPRLMDYVQSDRAETDVNWLLALCCRCIENGVVYVIEVDSIVKGLCCAEVVNGGATVHVLPTDSGKGLGKLCVARLRTWAARKSIPRLYATTTRLSGSSFRYFEKSLGFRRNAITFTLEV